MENYELITVSAKALSLANTQELNKNKTTKRSRVVVFLRQHRPSLIPSPFGHPYVTHPPLHRTYRQRLDSLR